MCLSRFDLGCTIVSVSRGAVLLAAVTMWLVIAGHIVFGQKLAGSDLRTPCTQDTRVSVENIENYNWSYCKLDLRPFWNSLQIPAAHFTDSQSLFLVSSTYGDIDGDGMDERFLHLRNLSNQVSRILILKPPATQVNRWRTVGFLDLYTFHLQPEARVVTNGRERWLAVSDIEKAWGTGLLQTNQTWYTLNNGQLREVLSFPAEGHISRVGIPSIAIKFTTNIEISRFGGSEDRINVRYTTTVGDFADLPIQTTVRFTKAASDSAFRLDSTGSTISSGDFRAIFQIESGKLSDQRFLNFAYPTLRVVAQRGAESREWLNQLLESCDATTTKVCTDLTKLLEKRGQKRGH